MTDETFQSTLGTRQQELGQRNVAQESPQFQTAFESKTNQANAIKCPHCGTVNDADALYCASCGASLQMCTCPNCGSEVDADADFCEVCHSYIKRDVCSFCGAMLNEQDAFCHECGSPRGGIVCPTCHTLNEFSFCKQCGTALTDEARQLAAQIRQLPEYQQLAEVVQEYGELSMELPYRSEREMLREKECEALRERVFRLLAEDDGLQQIVIPPSGNKRISKEVLNARKAEAREKIAQLLNKMAIPPQPKSATVRNFAMAQKPIGVRLAWQCYYKNAMHSSPCGCAKPQLGGKWVVLGHSTIKDDK